AGNQIVLAEEPPSTGMCSDPFLKHSLQEWRQRNSSGRPFAPGPFLLVNQNRICGKINIVDVQSQQLGSPRTGVGSGAEERINPRLRCVRTDILEQFRDLVGPKVQTVPKVLLLTCDQIAAGYLPLDLLASLKRWL